ncbi:hypothetical protein F183_A52060 [Bryobacterales bacterium F-183]|nr:hypothetical protein F183_A52060 [Bryobacterales bacterium F-183]
MRRGSVIGPLVLIAIGVIFLLRNVWPQIQIMDFVARNWPYVLIAWGALRLVELFSWKSSGRPLPESGVSGGEWFLIVVLCMFGMGLYAFNRHSGGWWSPAGIRVGGWDIMGDSFDFNYDVQTQKTASKTPKIVIESFRGDAQITGSDSDEVRVSGRKSIRALDNAEADRVSKDSPLEVVTQGDTIIIRSNQERADSRNRITSRFEIVVPRGASIDARGRYGDFDIRDINGTVQVYSDNAGVRLDNIAGNVKVDLRRSDIIRAIGIKGDLDLRGRGDDIELENISGTVTINGGYSGTVQFRNLAKPVRYEGVNASFQMEGVRGEVRSTISNLYAADVVGPVRVTSSKAKDVELINFTDSAEITIDRGDIELRPGRTPLPKISATTKNGEVNVALPDKARFEVRVSASRGDITNDYGAGLKVEDQGSRGHKIDGVVGGVGGPVISLTSGRGDIKLTKDDAPAPPSPVAPPSAPRPPTRVE